MKPLNHCFQNSTLFQNRLNHYREIATPSMTQNVHVYTICCRLEVVGDVIFTENVKTIEGYSLSNFEAAVVEANIDDSIK